MTRDQLYNLIVELLKEDPQLNLHPGSTERVSIHSKKTEQDDFIKKNMSAWADVFSAETPQEYDVINKTLGDAYSKLLRELKK